MIINYQLKKLLQLYTFFFIFIIIKEKKTDFGCNNRTNNLVVSCKGKKEMKEVGRTTEKTDIPLRDTMIIISV